MLKLITVFILILILIVLRKNIKINILNKVINIIYSYSISFISNNYKNVIYIRKNIINNYYNSS